MADLTQKELDRMLSLLERIATALERQPAMTAFVAQPLCLHLDCEETTAGRFCRRCGTRLVNLGGS